MADSNITKRALASVFKKLMEEMPFSKISVSDICERCQMNRKSFYYHFKDKYELVNWIFDTEFLDAIHEQGVKTGWDILSILCHYLYANKEFYRRALKIEGQNSFEEHFRETLGMIVSRQLEDLIQIHAGEFAPELSQQDVQTFVTALVTDGVVSAIVRWLMDKKPMSADIFLQLLRSFIHKMSDKVQDERNS